MSKSSVNNNDCFKLYNSEKKLTFLLCITCLVNKHLQHNTTSKLGAPKIMMGMGAVSNSIIDFINVNFFFFFANTTNYNASFISLLMRVPIN
jgi:hypothetical protein